jgi:hypothetical protein
MITGKKVGFKNFYFLCFVLCKGKSTANTNVLFVTEKLSIAHMQYVIVLGQL